LLIPTSKEDETLDELMQTILGHHPTIGESIRIGDFELIVEDAPLIGDKVILVKSL
jgi:Mg2+/Co2+ transporter CorC